MASSSTSQASLRDKASWDDEKVVMFLNILIQEIDAGNRPNGQFTKTGWSNIIRKFREETSCSFSQSQLKNKWDGLKKDLTLWERLRLEDTGLGFNHVTKTIEAEPEWWILKLAVMIVTCFLFI